MRYRALVEAPAGLASFSLYVHGGRHCRPPISRMGNKAGYAHALAALADIQPGEGAGAYVWAEADADVRALLRVYPDAAALMRIAEIIRGWKNEEPRALWERLRAERKARGPVVDDVGAAGWIVDAAWSIGNDAGSGGFKSSNATGEWFAPQTCEKFSDRCHRLAEFALLGQWAYRRGEPESGLNHGLLEDRAPTATGGHAARGRTAEAEAGGFERVAGWSTLSAWTKQNDPGGSMYMGPDRPSGCHEPGWVASITTDGLGRRYSNLASRWPPVAVLAALPTADALAGLLGTPGDLDGVLVYMDPPYRNTTGYASDLPRAEVVAHALDYARLGARVMVSEAVAVEELVALGWEATDIGHARRGQKRTFARVGSEVVTLNFAPVRTQERAVQVAMFDSVRP